MKFVGVSVNLKRVGLVASLALVAGCSSPKAVHTSDKAGSTSARSPYTAADVVGIAVGIYPEGTVPGPVVVGLPGASEVVSLLPPILPVPSVQRPGCEPDSGLVYLALRNGTTLSYGPCALPNELHGVLGAMWSDHVSGVAAIHARVMPNGPSFDAYAGQPGFDEVVDTLGWPLRPPEPEPASCSSGATVEVDGTDGTKVTYGPCRLGLVMHLLTRMAIPASSSAAVLSVAITTSVVEGAGAQPFTLDTDHTVIVRGAPVMLRVTVTAAQPMVITMPSTAFTTRISGTAGTLDVIGPFCPPSVDLGAPGPLALVCGVDSATILAGTNRAAGPIPAGPTTQSPFTLTLRTDRLGVGHYVLYEVADWRPADDATARAHPVDIRLTFDVLPASLG